MLDLNRTGADRNNAKCQGSKDSSVVLHCYKRLRAGVWSKEAVARSLGFDSSKKNGLYVCGLLVLITGRNLLYR